MDSGRRFRGYIISIGVDILLGYDGRDREAAEGHSHGVIKLQKGDDPRIAKRTVVPLAKAGGAIVSPHTDLLIS